MGDLWRRPRKFGGLRPGLLRATERSLRDDGARGRGDPGGNARRGRPAGYRRRGRGKPVNSLIERVKSAMVGLGTGWILALMLLLSIMSLAIMLERAWLYWSLRDDIEDLMRDLGKLLRGGDLQGARRRLEGSRSAEAAFVVAALVEADPPVQPPQEPLQGASALQRMKLEKRLAFLGTLGNNAPFIRLLGAVIPILAP